MRPPACDTKPSPSAATSTVNRRPARCTFKVTLPSRSFDRRQAEEFLLRRTVQRPRPVGAALLHARSGLIGDLLASLSWQAAAFSRMLLLFVWSGVARFVRGPVLSLARGTSRHSTRFKRRRSKKRF